ncbi:uncharacterized protein L203_101931 [Cryptococcus depauperatus CBS 7841]|uniref:Uncharacterized protein n=1 Tax=Cryptococcus depauperatus CBS 7841 TaxID=1295531 RepID=A0A1E3IHA8_9TREE|nr:hypothetical protein L203_03176 [Cryptococcus depauperatus CBS 7841]
MTISKSVLPVTLLIASSFNLCALGAPHPIVKVGEVLAGGYTNGISVYANNVTQCGYANVTWIGATPPVTLEIGQGGYYVGTTSIANLSAGWDSHTNWLVNQPAGVHLMFQIVDAQGKKGYVQNIKVEDGDSSCMRNNTGSSKLCAAGSETASGIDAAATESLTGLASTVSDAPLEESDSPASSPDSTTPSSSSAMNSHDHSSYTLPISASSLSNSGTNGASVAANAASGHSSAAASSRSTGNGLSSSNAISFALPRIVVNRLLLLAALGVFTIF